MRRIALAATTSIVALSIAAFSTFAVWSDAVAVSNNKIQTGTVDLQVSTNNANNEGTWNNTQASSSMVLSGLYPGGPAVSGYSFSLKNASTVAANFGIAGQIAQATITPNANVDKTQLMIQLYNTQTNAAESAEASLDAWMTLPPQPMVSPLAQNQVKNYGVRARLIQSQSNQNEWQGQTVNFTLAVAGASI